MPSYSPVFSTGFLFSTDDTPNQLFEIPTGFTAVVRDVTCTCLVGGVYMEAYVYAAGAPEGCIFTLCTLDGVASAFQWQGRVAIAAPGFIGFNQSAFDLGTSVYIGGYLLRNTLT